MKKFFDYSIFQMFFLGISILLFTIFYQTGNMIGTVFALLVLVVTLISLSFTNWPRNVPFVLFLISFTTFLLGRVIVTGIFNYNTELLGYLGTSFSDSKIVLHMFLLLFISLVSLYVGYLFRVSIKEKRTEKSAYYVSEVSKVLFLISFLFRLIVLAEMILSSRTYGYVESFSTFSSSLPGVFQIFADMYDITLFIFLSTKPNKKTTYLFLSLYMIDGIGSLISGRRSIFLLNLIIIVVYIFFRQITNEDKNEKWITKKMVSIFAVSIPFLLIMMNIIGNVRNLDGDGSNTGGILDSIKQFFYSQGVSINILGYVTSMDSTLPKNNYTFGPIIEFIKKNVLSLFGDIDKSMFFGQNVYRAINGNLFSHTISYYINPNLYLQGVGYGGSYIAELYHDFSYLGVIIGNVFYGFLLRNFYGFVNRFGPIVQGCMFIMLRQIMFSPRSGYTNFVATALSVPNVLGIALVIIGSQVLRELSRL